MAEMAQQCTKDQIQTTSNIHQASPDSRCKIEGQTGKVSRTWFLAARSNSAGDVRSLTKSLPEKAKMPLLIAYNRQPSV
jgi:hypothetical protein